MSLVASLCILSDWAELQRDTSPLLGFILSLVEITLWEKYILGWGNCLKSLFYSFVLWVLSLKVKKQGFVAQGCIPPLKNIKGVAKGKGLYLLKYVLDVVKAFWESDHRKKRLSTTTFFNWTSGPFDSVCQLSVCKTVYCKKLVFSKTL
jgi:hypothetical protein